jgi:hypothetical protein
MPPFRGTQHMIIHSVRKRPDSAVVHRTGDHGLVSSSRRRVFIGSRSRERSNRSVAFPYGSWRLAAVSSTHPVEYAE